jgi:hypothetical protein
LLPEQASTSPVHVAAVVHVRPVALAQQTWLVESQGPPAPQTIWLGPPSPRGLPPPSVAPPDDELPVPDDEPPMMIQDPSPPESSPDAPPSPPEEVLVASVAPPSDEETLLVDPLQAAAPTTTNAPHPSHMFRQSITVLL